MTHEIKDDIKVRLDSWARAAIEEEANAVLSHIPLMERYLRSLDRIRELITKLDTELYQDRGFFHPTYEAEIEEEHSHVLTYINRSKDTGFGEGVIKVKELAVDISVSLEHSDADIAGIERMNIAVIVPDGNYVVLYSFFDLDEEDEGSYSAFVLGFKFAHKNAKKPLYMTTDERGVNINQLIREMLDALRERP